MQIGPRIRVGGSVGKMGQKLKVGAGKLASKAAPIVSFINPALGTALGVAGDALDTTDGKFNVGNAVKRGVMNYGVGKIGGKVLSPLMSKVPGVNRIPGLGGGEPDLSGIDGARDFVSKINVDNLGKAGGGGGGWSGISSLVSGNGGGMGDRFRKLLPQNMDDLLDLGEFAGNAIGNYQEGQREDELFRRDRDEWNRRAPLRDAGMRGMLDDSRPDLSGVFGDQSAPRYRRVAVGSRV